MSRHFRDLFPIILLFFLTSFTASSQESTGDDEHEFIIFLTRSSYPLDWESPSTLYKTAKKSWSQSTFNKNNSHFMGHASFMLKSPLVGDENLWMGITSNTTRDMVNLLFKEKIGLGVLGVAFYSKLETKENIIESLTMNSEHTDVSYISFLISEESAGQILEFIDYFQDNYEQAFPPPSNYYGGIFWPLYKGEGAGCSALCLAALESGGVMVEDSIKNQWLIKKNLPTDLVGGRFNENKKVPLRKIKKRKEWHMGEGIRNVDYIEFEIYDPNYMLDWVNTYSTAATSDEYELENGLQLKGVQFDFRNVKPHEKLDDIIQERPDSSPFVEQFKESVYKQQTAQ